MKWGLGSKIWDARIHVPAEKRQAVEQIVAKGRIAVGATAAALWVLLGFGLGVSAFAQGSAPAQPIVDKLVLDDTIQPVSADEVTRALDRANSDGASALLIEINTPGGLLDSMRDMVGGILR
jgi:membrane-bound serine protease (ClpP class)